MSALQITAVLIRLFAIWCGIDAASWVLSLWDPSQVGESGKGCTIAFSALYIAVAVALWTFPTLIARRMLLPSDAPAAAVADPKALLNVAVVAIGLLMLAQGLPGAINTVLLLVEAGRWDVTLESDRGYLRLRVALSFLHPLLGLLLLVRATAVTRLLWPRVEDRRSDA